MLCSLLVSDGKLENKDQARLGQLEEIKVDLFRGYPVDQFTLCAEKQFTLKQQQNSGENLICKSHYFKSLVVWIIFQTEIRSGSD